MQDRTLSRRIPHLTAVWCAAMIALCAERGLADDAKQAPAGLRVFYTGHSFHMFVPPRVEQLVKSAGIKDHRHVGTQGIGGSRVIQHWDLAEAKNKARPALETGEVDVFTMAVHLEVPDPGIDKLAELGLKHNPKLRLLVQASWMPFDLTTSGERIRSNAERDNIDLAALRAATMEWRTRLERQVDALNQQHGQKALFIVPAGDAVNTLRERIVAGTYPELSKQSELFRDPIGHGLGHVQALVAYCNFAAIYQRSPQGLKLVEPGVNDEQHAILQQIAWDVVSKYPYAGVGQP
jgi:hypothetical protein